MQTTKTTIKTVILAAFSILAVCAPWTQVRAQSDIDLTGYTLTFADEFDSLSFATSSPKGAAKWYAGYPPNGSTGVYGFAVRDPASLSVSNGILSNKLWLEPFLSVSGARCGGPVGMKTSAGTPMITLVAPGAQTNTNGYWQWYGWTGMKFTVGSSPVTVSQLGRYALATNTQTHQVRILDAATGADVAKATVNCAGQSGFVYANIIGGAVTLQANKAYYLLTDNNSGGDMFFDTNTTVSTTGGITINESTWGAWHSGALYSVDATGAGFSQKYGYFEMRAKLPASGTGSWPAFWMKTTNDITNSGNVEEIDIFEWYGNNYSANPQQALIQQASHNWIGGGGEDNTTPYLYSPSTPMPGGAFPWAGYHIYGFKADPTYCTWYIDGVQTNRIATPTAYMANPFYMILEYSIGGGWPLDGLVANSKVEIDWIRVYSLPSAGGIPNGGFETPNVGAASYQLRPAGATWTFTGYSYIQSNGSAWGAANAPDGTQTGVLQGYSGTLGSISQTVNLGAGSYTLSFRAARRGSQIQPVRVSVDGTVVGTYTPASSSFEMMTTVAFTVAAGNHTITLAATDSSGDKSSFIDSVSIQSTTIAVPNGGFETPNVGAASYQLRPAGATWTFTGYSYIQSNGSAFGAANAPDGTQTGVLQGYSGTLGSISQTVNLNADSYTLSFQAARRGSQVQPVRVSVDGTVVGTYTPASSSFALMTTAAFTVAAGNHTITLAATDSTGDKSSLIDSVSINVAGSGISNVALASNGATATASSTYSTGFPASGAINGDRKGLNWGNGGGWNDATSWAYPDWLEVAFSGSKIITEIDVFTKEDGNPVEPTLTTTFTLDGITAFDVQYWNGSAWVTVPGGSVTGNNKVWRQFTFSPITTSKIRVVVNAAASANGAYSRITEIEAW
ncbi:MAG: family 16 glycosylhydrolase [Terrimicrobiaceae bacterium]